MTPQQHATHDAEALQELGRASVEIVHDIKNQLNGLKLYATFLRRRCERDQRPADELETVNKIIAGLERSAAELSLLVRYGRPVELRHAPHTDLAQIVRAAAGGEAEIEDGADFIGDLDAEKLGEAFADINTAVRARTTADSPARVKLRRDTSAGGGGAAALVEWRGVAGTNGKNIFGALDGNASLRTALAARVVAAHGGKVSHEGDTVSVRIPLKP
jgi:signal transduction histidine kinase